MQGTFSNILHYFYHRKRKSITGPCPEARFDGNQHWIVSTELDQKEQPKRRNCKQCALEGKKDLKSVNMCEKCQVPLHTHCFKERIFMAQIFFHFLFGFRLIC